MSFTNEEAHTFFLEHTSHFFKTTPRPKKCAEAATKFIECKVPGAEHKFFHRKFERLLEGKPGNKASADDVSAWKESVFYEVKPPSDEKPQGRPSTTLGGEPCMKKQRTILKSMVENIESFAENQNLTKEDALKRIIDECNRKWNSSVQPQKSTIPVPDATALMYNVNLSVHQYQTIRTVCLLFGVVFPPRNSIDAYKRTLHPDITSFQLKSSVNIKSLLDETASSLIQLNKSAGREETGEFRMVGKFGVDGSGSHKIRQQLIDTALASEETEHLDPTKCNSFLLSCYVPLELHRGNTILWTNPVPNSTSYARPVSLTRTAEEREVLAVELESSFPVIRDEYRNVLTMDDVNIDLVCETQCSMIDGKMVALLQGDSGAFCHLCHATRADANDPALIAEGFTITKDYNSCKEAWEKLEAGDIAYTSVERQGQCHENLVKADLHCFSVLHFKLRSLDFAQKILYRLQGGVKVWSEQAHLHALRFITRAKKECIEAIRASTGILMDSPCGSGGNTNNGPLADRFFSGKNRSHICNLILNTEDRENFATFMSLTNVILTVVQSTNNRLVCVDKLKELGIELMLHLKNNFLDDKGLSWVMIIPTFHQMSAHSWELFQWNGSQSISRWSESPLESWNKHVRSFQSGPAARSRQLSIKDNIRDVFRRMLITSHPEIASKRPRPCCSICGEVGHTARSSRHKEKSSVSTQEQSRIESMYY